MTEPFLTIWTIYERPTDWPDWYVARPFDIIRGTPEPVPRRDGLIMMRRLEPLRKEMKRMGLTCLPRAAQDEPQIVESWI